MMEADFIEFATTNLAKTLEDYDEQDYVIDEVRVCPDDTPCSFLHAVISVKITRDIVWLIWEGYLSCLIRTRQLKYDRLFFMAIVNGAIAIIIITKESFYTLG